jgi:hypothetical protein
MGAVGMGEVNRNPRRWTDRSARVRVIEGWHPSQPTRLGYNLVIDGDWIGTFDSLDGAAETAASSLRRPGLHRKPEKLVLVPYLDPRRSGGE